MKTKKVAAGLSILLVAGMAAGCGNGNSDTNSPTPEAGSSTATAKQVTIKYHTWTPAKDYENVVKTFEAKNPGIKVEVNTVVENDATETMKKLDILSASGEEMDVIELNSMATYAKRAQTNYEPLDSYLVKEGVKFSDEYKSDMSLNGKIYALPGIFQQQLVMLNKDFLDEANLPVPKDWTWDDFQDYAKKLTKGEGATKRYGTHFHTFKEFFRLTTLSLPADQGLMKDDASGLNLDNPNFKKSLELMNQSQNVDKTAASYSDVISQKIPYRNQYFGGKAAMIPIGSFLASEAGGTDKLPVTFKTVFAPIPKNAKADEFYSNGSSNPLVISAASKHKEEAYKFLRFLTTEGIPLKASGGLSSWKKSDLNKELDVIIKQSLKPELIDKESLVYTLSVSKFGKAPVVPDYLAELEKAYVAEAEKYLLGKADINTTMTTLKTSLQKIVDANKK
jgi:multiple sugar transport system substrate-binding protein